MSIKARKPPPTASGLRPSAGSATASHPRVTAPSDGNGLRVLKDERWVSLTTDTDEFGCGRTCERVTEKNDDITLDWRGCCYDNWSDGYHYAWHWERYWTGTPPWPGPTLYGEIWAYYNCSTKKWRLSFYLFRIIFNGTYDSIQNVLIADNDVDPAPGDASGGTWTPRSYPNFPYGGDGYYVEYDGFSTGFYLSVSNQSRC